MPKGNSGRDFRNPEHLSGAFILIVRLAGNRPPRLSAKVTGVQGRGSMFGSGQDDATWRCVCPPVRALSPSSPEHCLPSEPPPCQPCFPLATTDSLAPARCCHSSATWTWNPAVWSPWDRLFSLSFVQLSRSFFPFSCGICTVGRFLF